MIEILQFIQRKYVPVSYLEADMEKSVHVIQPIFLGGDNLTEERARNLQGAMADGETDLDRLGGILPKNEDWHAIRYMYKVSNLKTY